MDSKLRKQLLSEYDDLRVCDVRDGMDAMGYHFFGSVDQSIRPLFRAKAFGIAKTVRYLPYRGGMEYKGPRQYRDEFTPFFYNEVCTYEWWKDIQDGDFLMIDQSGMTVGLIGSANSLGYWNKGMKGLATNGGIRDTDEIILQKIPCWSATIAQTMVQARLAFGDMDKPIGFGGVQVCPGDMVVADGDGVIVVPQEIALDVAKYSHEEHEDDKKNRKKGYDEAGRHYDDTLK